MQTPNCSGYPSVFVNVGENLIMADDVTTPSNPPFALIEEEELKEAPFDVNVFQQSRKEEPSKRVVRIWVYRSAWDRQWSPNSHALAIYLKFVPSRGVALERFEKCQCEDDDVHFHCQTWVPNDGHYRCPINPLPMEHQAKYLACTIRRILDFLQLWIIPFKSFTKL